MPSLGFHVLPSPDCLVLPLTEQPRSSTRLDFFSCHRLVGARRVRLKWWYGGDIFV